MISRNQTYALLAGLSVGAAVAILYAPQSGAKTRKSLLEGLETTGDRVANAGEYLRTQADHFNTQAQAAIDHTRKQVEEVLKTANTTVTATIEQANKAFSVNLDQASSAIASAVGAATGKRLG